MSEFAIQSALVQHLRLRAAPNVYWFHPANGEARSKATGGRLKAMGVRPGTPDLMLVINGVAHFLELKAPGKRPSKVQQQAHSEINAAGGFVAWSDSVDGALSVLQSWGAIR
jgi:hypothetical protein